MDDSQDASPLSTARPTRVASHRHPLSFLPTSHLSPPRTPPGTSTSLSSSPTVPEQVTNKFSSHYTWHCKANWGKGKKESGLPSLTQSCLAMKIIHNQKAPCWEASLEPSKKIGGAFLCPFPLLTAGEGRSADIRVKMNHSYLRRVEEKYRGTSKRKKEYN